MLILDGCFTHFWLLLLDNWLGKYLQSTYHVVLIAIENSSPTSGLGLSCSAGSCWEDFHHRIIFSEIRVQVSGSCTSFEWCWSQKTSSTPRKFQDDLCYFHVKMKPGFDLK